MTESLNCFLPRKLSQATHSAMSVVSAGAAPFPPSSSIDFHTLRPHAERRRLGILFFQLLVILQTVALESACFQPTTASRLSSSPHAPLPPPRPPTSLGMGKGDGKKKRKKKAAPSSVSSASPPAVVVPAPLRVTSNSIIPVRRQIRYAQMNKEYKKNSGTSFRQSSMKRTKYRKSIAEEEQEAARVERKKRGQEPEWDVILNGTAASPLVFVDAYNVIFQWPRLKKWMVKGSTQRARDLFVADLEDLVALKGWRIECVFDGFGRSVGGPLGDGPGGLAAKEKIPLPERQFTRVETGRGVRVVFSGVGASADSYIESRCAEAKAVTGGKLTGSLIVASNDAMVRMAALSAGALCMSSDRLVSELRSVQKITSYRVEAAMAIANGGHVRPEELRGQSQLNTLGGQPFIIEDKRKRKKEKNENDVDAPKRVEFGDIVAGTKTIPAWAQVPDSTKTES